MIKIDRTYIRTCAVYKLLKQGKIKSKKVALALLQNNRGRGSNIENTLSLWLKYSLKNLQLTD